MPMNQKTTSPVPIQPGRKVNPKMTTNRSMMVPQGDQAQSEAAAKRKKKAKKGKKRKVSTTKPAQNVQPDFIAPQTPQQPQKRGGANIATNAAPNTQQIATIIYNNLGKTIVDDELLEEKDKKEVCVLFAQDLGGTTVDILQFLNGSDVKELVSLKESLNSSLSSLHTLYQQQQNGEIKEEEKSSWKQTVKKLYEKAEKESEEIVKIINESFMEQTSKYNYFKELVVLVNSFPYGEIPSFVHKKFYIFTVSLIKAGLINILMEDFNPQQQ